MSEKRADLFESGRGNVNSKSAYEAPVAEWHDLQVITLGGSPGGGDSGNTGNQRPAGNVNYYDENPDDQYGDYV